MSVEGRAAHPSLLADRVFKEPKHVQGEELTYLKLAWHAVLHRRVRYGAFSPVTQQDEAPRG